jgi:Na+/proline symporter
MDSSSESFKKSYLLANREIGWKRGGFTIAATWTWAVALLVPSQKAFEEGFAGAFWYFVPSVLTLFIYNFFLSKVDEVFLNNYTLSGLMGKKWGKGVQKEYSIILALLQIMSYAINIIAGATTICALLKIDYLWCTVVLGFIVLAYTIWGGFRSSVNTDVIQTIVLCAGSIFIIVFLFYQYTSAGKPILQALSRGMKGYENGNYDSLFSAAGGHVFLTYGLTSFFGLITGPFGDQMYWQRAFAIPKKYRKKAFRFAAILFSIIPIAMILIGFFAASQVGEQNLIIRNPGNVAVEYLSTYLPGFCTVFFVLMVGSAITSTMDSCLCAFSSIIVNDFCKDDKDNSKTIARFGMIIMVVGSVLIANIPGITTLHLFMVYTVIRMCTFCPTVITCLRKDDGVHYKAVFWGIVFSLIVATPIYAYSYYKGIAVMQFVGTLLSIGIPAVFILISRKRGING